MTSNGKHPVIPCALIAAGIFAAALNSQQQGYQPAPPSVPALDCAWLDLQDIGNGVELQTMLAFTPHVVEPETGATMRAVSIHTDFVYDVGVMQQLNYLKLHDVADTSPLVWKFIGVDRNLVHNPPSPLDILTYEVTITPKPGHSWGTVQNATQLDISALEI